MSRHQQRLYLLFGQKNTLERREEIFEKFTSRNSPPMSLFEFCHFLFASFSRRHLEIWCCHQWYFPLIFHIFVLLEWSVGEKDSSDNGRFQSINIHLLEYPILPSVRPSVTQNVSVRHKKAGLPRTVVPEGRGILTAALLSTTRSSSSSSK